MVNKFPKNDFVILAKYIDHKEQVIVPLVEIAFKYLIIIVHSLIIVSERETIDFL